MRLEPEVAKALRKFVGPRLAVLVWANSVLVPTEDLEDEADCEDLYLLYKQWPNRQQMPETTFRNHLEALGYDVYRDPFTGTAVVLGHVMDGKATAQAIRDREARAAEARRARRAAAEAAEREADEARLANAPPPEKVPASWKKQAEARRRGKACPIAPALVFERARVWRTDAELAASFGKGTKTWRRWLRKHPELKAAVARARGQD